MATMRASRAALRLSKPVYEVDAASPLSSRPGLPSEALQRIAHHIRPMRYQSLPSVVDPSSEEYKENARQMGEVMAKLEKLTRKIHEGGPPKAREKHIARKEDAATRPESRH
jgi:3-methylcrotonyl-CoA carboxylase beta subunit